jgi:hypothetical protein
METSRGQATKRLTLSSWTAMGRFVLINLLLTNMVLYMMFFYSWFQMVSYNDWIITDLESFSKVTVRKKYRLAK